MASNRYDVAVIGASPGGNAKYLEARVERFPSLTGPYR